MHVHPTPPLAGTRAPNFTLPRTHYESFSLSDLHGQPAVLVFYPGDWEPVSRQQLTLYQECLPEIHRFGAALVGISVDSIWSHSAFGTTLDLSYPLLSDFQPKGRVSHAYGVYSVREGRSARAVFVLDAEGMVCWSHVYPTNLNPGIDGILTTLERMHTKSDNDEPTVTNNRRH